MLKLRVFKLGEFIEINDEMDFYVGTCGSGRTVFGEKAKLTRTTANHLIFTTESGTIVKTNYNMTTIGKAAKNNYWVGVGDRTNEPNYINQRVHYWNDSKCCFEYK